MSNSTGDLRINSQRKSNGSPPAPMRQTLTRNIPGLTISTPQSNDIMK